MPARKSDDPKTKALAEAGTLHPDPQQVSDELFGNNPFFDPRDGLQVKYEMLRRVRVDGHPVSQAAASCGLSRPTYYQARKAFERNGLVGLLPDKKGPKRAHKLTAEVLAFIDVQLKAEPGLAWSDLADRVGEQFGFDVHPKSVARARARALSKKKPHRTTRT